MPAAFFCCLAIALLVSLRGNAVQAEVPANSQDSAVDSVEFKTQEIYRAKEKPAYTSWVSFFPGHKGEWYLSFEEVRKVMPPLAPTSLDDWYRMVVPDGYDKSPYQMEVVLLRSDDQCATWQEISREPVRFQHSAGSFGQVRTRDGRFLRGMWNCYKLDEPLQPGRFLYESSDDGKTWQNMPALLDDRFCAYPHRMKQLRDGTIVLAVPYGPMWGSQQEHPTRISRLVGETDSFGMALFISRNEGKNWEGPIPILSGQQVSETDFVELPKGDLLAIVSAAFDRPGRQIIHRVGNRFVPGTFLALQRESGIVPPECITLTADGILVGCYRGAQYLWSDDLAKTWHRLAGTVSTQYQPMIHQMADGRIACAWHKGFDDPIATADQFVGIDFFRLQVNQKRAETKLQLIRKFDPAANQFLNAFTLTLTAGDKPLRNQPVELWHGPRDSLSLADRSSRGAAVVKAITDENGRADVTLQGIGSEGNFEVMARYNHDESDRDFRPTDSPICLFYATAHGNGGKPIPPNTPQ